MGNRRSIRIKERKMSKDSTPKRHHYLPQFYLRGFSNKGFGDKKGRVRTLDFIGQKCFTTSPKDVANIADYYTIQTPDGEGSVVVEKDLLARIDTESARIIGKIEKTHDLPTGDDWMKLCLFVASLQVRTPLFRQQNHELAQHMVDVLAPGKDGDLEGVNPPEPSSGSVTFSDLKHLIQDENLEVAIPRTENVVSMVKMIPQIAAIASQMTPYIFGATENGRFITGHAPIHKFDSNDDRRQSRLMGVGWATPEVNITVPLTQNCCLVLAWGDQKLPQPTPANNSAVAGCNSSQFSICSQFAFAPDANFPFLWEDKICWGEAEAIKRFSELKSRPAIGIGGGPIPRRPPKRVQR
jgi:hypothetical protein